MAVHEHGTDDASAQRPGILRGQLQLLGAAGSLRQHKEDRICTSESGKVTRRSRFFAECQEN